MQKSETSSAAQVRIKLVRPQDGQLLKEVIELGDRFNKTLGFLTPAAYAQAAERGTLLAALLGRKLVGYSLFALPRQQVRLTHLCVDPDARRQGVARLLISEISSLHHDRTGIVLKCRKDYGYDEMWIALGFEARNEVPGRGKDRKPLVVWWLDHQHPHLFSDVEAESEALLTVAMDCNVFVDLHSTSTRHGAAESLGLNADWLTGLVNLAVLPQLRHEVGKIQDAGERGRQLRATHAYSEPTVSRPDADRLHSDLLVAVNARIGKGRSLSANDLADLRYVAEAGASRTRFLVTRDEFLASLSDIALSLCQVRILRPSDIVLHVDELTRAQVYQPGDLLNTSLTVRVVSSGQEKDQLIFLNRPAGEKRTDFLGRLRDLASNPKRWIRQEVLDSDGRPVATYCYGVRDRQFIVPLLRVLDSHVLHETLARQIIFQLRHHCRESGVQVLRLVDEHIQPAVRIAANEDGFQRNNGALTALVLGVCADSNTVQRDAEAAAQIAGLDIPVIPATMAAAAASAMERAWWPVKITDAEIPSFLIPIKPIWAGELFGFPAALVPRNDKLGISREHVYYRTSPSKGERAPARILWYASTDKNQSVSAVIASSRLDGTVVDGARALYSRFRHLGVWGLEDIQAACGDRGVARALLFSDTEMLSRPVTLKRLRALGAQHHHAVNVRSVSKITPALFSAIYREGRPTK